MSIINHPQAWQIPVKIPMDRRFVFPLAIRPFPGPCHVLLGLTSLLTLLLVFHHCRNHEVRDLI